MTHVGPTAADLAVWIPQVGPTAADVAVWTGVGPNKMFRKFCKVGELNPQPPT